MNPIRKLVGAIFRGLLVIVCTIAIAPGDTLAYMTSSGSAQAASPQDQTAKIPPDQLDSLVAPIAATLKRRTGPCCRSTSAAANVTCCCTTIAGSHGSMR